MYQFKTLYVRNVAEDLIKKKKIVAIFVCICAIFFAGLGIRQGNKKIELSEEQQQELDDYNLKLAEYDSVIADVEKGISEADKQICRSIMMSRSICRSIRRIFRRWRCSIA